MSSSAAPNRHHQPMGGPPHPPPPPPPPPQQQSMSRRVGGGSGGGPAFPPNEAQIQRGMLVLIYRAPMNGEILMRPEAQSLQACLDQGNVTPDLLLHQFIHGNLAPFQREILLNVLKVAQNQGKLGPVPPMEQQQQQQRRGGGGGGGNHQQLQPTVSPRSSPQHQQQAAAAAAAADPFMMLMNQQQQQQQRASPAARVVGRSSSTLSVSPLPPGQQRVPSPQELMVHTQQIMQNALIKRKLKEQEESFRKRMEQQPATSKPAAIHSDQKLQGEPSANNAAAAVKSSGGGSTHSPTSRSLAFAPTVVMKKMAADRRDSDPKLATPLPELKVSQAASAHQQSHALQAAVIGPHGDGGSGAAMAAAVNKMAAAAAGSHHNEDGGGGRISPGRFIDQIALQQRSGGGD